MTINPFEIGTQSRTKVVNGVTCRSVSVGVKSKIESLVAATSGKASSKDCVEVRWIALLHGCTDDNGECIFKKEDRSRFSQLESWFVEPIFEAILKLSGVNDQDREDFEGN